MIRRSKFKFTLYVAGDAPNSVQAQLNLKAICQKALPDRHLIEVVDVFGQPNRALSDGIFMTPTLIKHWPLPVRKIVGTLSHAQTVLQALGIDGSAA